MQHNEETPLLGDTRWNSQDIHEQFCRLAGVPPSNAPKNAMREPATRRSLYGRAVHKRNVQNRTYMFTAALTNTLLLSQVVLGAALTGLGASESSHILITVFGALNTIIAGLVAYLKSRGQPMRARMFRDDLDRVVDEMENSEVMWLGIQSGAHGYDEIAIDDTVSVRSEVARLTRLYDKVVRNNTMNDRECARYNLRLMLMMFTADMYINATTDAANAALRARPGPSMPAPLIPTAPGAGTVDTTAPLGLVVPPTGTPDDPDAAPASAPPKSRTPPPKDQLKPDDASEAGAASSIEDSAAVLPSTDVA